MSTTRIESVDTFRLLAITSVIVIHTSPFRGNFYDNTIYEHFDVLINQAARFAVPFFFTLSGFFWGTKIRNGSNLSSVTIRMGKRIGLLFLIWSCIYLLPYNISSINDYGISGPIKITYWKILYLFEEPLKIVMEGSSVHLWFLIGLLFALFINFIFIQQKWFKSLVILSIALYVFGVLAKSYELTPIGFTAPFEFNTRNGPFLSTLLFTSGYVISGFKITHKWFLYGIVVTTIGYLIHFLEIYILWKKFEIPPLHDYVIGTYFMGVGMAIASLSNAPILKINMFSRLGQITLGIYLIHLIFVDLLKPFDKLFHSPTWEFSYVVLVFCLSVGCTVSLSKYRLIKKFIT